MEGAMLEPADLEIIGVLKRLEGLAI